MELIRNYLVAVWNMTDLMALYIFVGLITAGIIHEFISDEYIRNNLGGKGFWPSFKAAVLGVPLPLCSCGVIPLAASLRKSGAGKGAVTSFLIATPMTGADSIIATYGVFGWVITVMRVVSSFFAALFAGTVTDKLYGADEDKDPEPQPVSSCGCSSCGCHDGCCEDDDDDDKKTFMGRVKSVINYSFFELMEDIAFPLFVGLLLAALITMFITPETVGGLKGSAWIGYVGAFAVGIPLYVCSISAIPVAMSLLIAGFSPGAAFVFLSAAPATNAVTISIVKKFLGKRAVGVYVASIIIFTLIFALIVDYMFMKSGLDVKSFTGEKEGGTLLSHAAATVLIIYMLYMVVRSKIIQKLR